MRVIVLALAALSSLATFVLAHSGVQDRAVMARMMLMEDTADLTKRLGAIAKGTAPFDPGVIRDAAGKLADQAAQIPAAFEGRDTDPKSEALPVLWENWTDFVAKSDDMVRRAQALSQTGSLAEFRPAFVQFGQTCQACHERYRLQKTD